MMSDNYRPSSIRRRPVLFNCSITTHRFGLERIVYQRSGSTSVLFQWGESLQLFEPVEDNADFVWISGDISGGRCRRRWNHYHELFAVRCDVIFSNLGVVREIANR